MFDARVVLDKYNGTWWCMVLYLHTYCDDDWSHLRECIRCDGAWLILLQCKYCDGNDLSDRHFLHCDEIHSNQIFAIISHHDDVLRVRIGVTSPMSGKAQCRLCGTLTQTSLCSSQWKPIKWYSLMYACFQARKCEPWAAHARHADGARQEDQRRHDCMWQWHNFLGAAWTCCAYRCWWCKVVSVLRCLNPMLTIGD